MEFKKGTKILFIFIIIVNLIMCTSLVVLYGPWPYFRNTWITTAMATMKHQYLAHWFYSDKTIEEIMINNTVIESDESTDVSLIDEEIAPVVYTDKYEEQILSKENEDDIYKIVDISDTSYKGFLVAIYDASKISMVTTRFLGTKGETLDNIAKNNKALLAINASGFLDPEWRGNGGEPTGSIVKNGAIVWSATRPNAGGGVIGFTYNNKLVLTKESMKSALVNYNLRDAIEFGPFLIVNGKPSFVKGNGGWGIAPRTAIGQRQDGIVLLLIIDGRNPGYSIGADMVDLTEIMQKYKAYNAANLDGGASTGLIVNNSIYNKPCALSYNGLRRLPNAWIVTE
ncbi:MAG: phosphodiester glycosidase family protein [Bacilli bacterium]|jgi:exopolysaccharide biosynthesis protein